MNINDVYKFESQLGRYPVHLSMGNHYIKIDPSKVSNLVDTIKQLHAENERYREALDKIHNEGKSDTFAGYTCSDIAGEALHD